MELPQEFVSQIVEGLYLKLKPLIVKSNRSAVDDTIFDVKALCKYLSVSEKWVYERTHLKEIPHLKINGLLRFRKKEIDKWLDSYHIPVINRSVGILMAVKK